MNAADKHRHQLHVRFVTRQCMDTGLWLCRTIEIQDRSRLIDYELFSLYAMALLLLAGAGECCAAAWVCLSGVPLQGVCNAFLLLPHRMALLLLAALPGSAHLMLTHQAVLTPDMNYSLLDSVQLHSCCFDCWLPGVEGCPNA